MKRAKARGWVMESTAFLLSDKQAVAAGIREFRTRHDLSQTQLAVLSGVALRTIQYLEAKGTRPSPYTTMKLDAFMRRFESAGRG